MIENLNIPHMTLLILFEKASILIPRNFVNITIE